MIKAIETKYHGYRFRSRLEARWAVFFDAIRMPWEYEKEGFDIDGAWYLPDFYLPSLKIYAEVKPETFTEKEYSLIASLQGLVLDGLPASKYYIIAGKECSCMASEPVMNELRSIATTFCYKCYSDGRDLDYWGIDLLQSVGKGTLWYGFGCDIQDSTFAVESALGTRFEHDERETAN